MKNIVLIGMSGVGKTQKGKYIARKMQKNYLDTDTVIVEQECITIDEIFTKFGEKHFRSIEENVIKKISTLENSVISAGGGIVLRKTNMELLKASSFIVYLKGDINTIVDNLKQSNTIRPLLKNSEDLYKSVCELYKSREGLYQLYSHITIDIKNKSNKDIYNEVFSAYNEYITCDK
jgi:shikimate kinase